MIVPLCLKCPTWKRSAPSSTGRSSARALPVSRSPSLYQSEYHETTSSVSSPATPSVRCGATASSSSPPDGTHLPDDAGGAADAAPVPGDGPRRPLARADGGGLQAAPAAPSRPDQEHPHQPPLRRRHRQRLLGRDTLGGGHPPP